MATNVRDRRIRSKTAKPAKKCKPCEAKARSLEPMVNKPPKTKAEMHHGQCMIHVAEHWRGCSSRTAAKVKPAKRGKA